MAEWLKAHALERRVVLNAPRGFESHSRPLGKSMTFVVGFVRAE